MGGLPALCRRSLSFARYFFRKLRLNVIKVEQRVQYVEIPFSFAYLNIHDLTCCLFFLRMSRKIADVANGINIISNIARQIWQHCLNLLS